MYGVAVPYLMVRYGHLIAVPHNGAVIRYGTVRERVVLVLNNASTGRTSVLVLLLSKLLRTVVPNVLSHSCRALYRQSSTAVPPVRLPNFTKHCTLFAGRLYNRRFPVTVTKSTLQMVREVQELLEDCARLHAVRVRRIRRQAHYAGNLLRLRRTG